MSAHSLGWGELTSNTAIPFDPGNTGSANPALGNLVAVRFGPVSTTYTTLTYQFQWVSVSGTNNGQIGFIDPIDGYVAGDNNGPDTWTYTVPVGHGPLAVFDAGTPGPAGTLTITALIDGVASDNSLILVVASSMGLYGSMAWSATAPTTVPAWWTQYVKTVET